MIPGEREGALRTTRGSTGGEKVVLEKRLVSFCACSSKWGMWRIGSKVYTKSSMKWEECLGDKKKGGERRAGLVEKWRQGSLVRRLGIHKESISGGECLQKKEMNRKYVVGGKGRA